jgi:L-asparaginase
VDGLAEITVNDIIREGAETFTPREWTKISAAVRSAVADPAVDGVVVTHGTFTAEETAYFLHLTVATDKPVVVACSQRKHHTIGNDGDKNLFDAVRVASDPAARGQGVMTVLSEEIHCAREVTKTSQRPGGFHSNYTGLLGGVEADRVSLYRSPTRRHTARSEFAELALTADTVLPRVDVVATYAGADGVAVDAFLAAGAKGIVVNGFSYSGKPHHDQLASLGRAIDAGVPVVLTNRGGDGRIPVEDQHGFVRGDNLTAQKARVLLSLALAAGTPTADLQRVFNEY